MRPSLGRLGVIFDVGQASKANQSRLTFYKNHSLDWLALEAWPTSKMTPKLPKLGLISFELLSRTHKNSASKNPKNWGRPNGQILHKKLCNFIDADRMIL